MCDKCDCEKCECECHEGEVCDCGCDSGCDCGCDCCGDSLSPDSPIFWTKKEKIAWLEGYLADLQAEVKAVEERIAALKEE